MDTIRALRSPARLLRAAVLAAGPLLLAAVPAPALAHFSRAELEQMLAPIALYPDSVLSHVLIAATWPEDVAEAARWSRRHPGLSGQAAVAAVEDRDWDPSVRALVAFPEILARMEEDPDWADRVGEAFQYQEGEVMDSVQTLRDHAWEAGHLGSIEHVRVIREREYIYIEPALHHVVYVPYYDPWYVYGLWGWPSHPPYCWRRWGGYAVAHYGGGFHWGVGFRIAPSFYFTTFHWPARQVVVVHRHPGQRPLYSGRDARRHDGLRHWREERRPASAPPVDRRDRGMAHWRSAEPQAERRSPRQAESSRHERGHGARRDGRDETRGPTRAEGQRERRAAHEGPAAFRGAEAHTVRPADPGPAAWRRQAPEGESRAAAGRAEAPAAARREHRGQPDHRSEAAREHRSEAPRERRPQAGERRDRGRAQDGNRGRSARER